MFYASLAHRIRPLKHLSRSRRPALEGLEDRLLLYSTTGGVWAYNTITYSFVPDGTLIAQGFNGNITSNLNQTMNSGGISTQQWQQQFDAAAATWEAVANINLVRTSDDGLAIGSSNYQQGNPAEGDIRIGGYVQSSGVLAQTILPPPINGGSSAGNVFFNTAQTWQIGNNYDIESVALHEIGHALGMGHSQIQQAVMYADYTGVKQQLNSDDIAGIDSIYGSRQPDAFNSNGLNNSQYYSAASISNDFNSQDQITLPNLSINTASQSEWFAVTIPAGASPALSATMQSVNLSSLSPQIVIYNSAFKMLSHGTAPYSYGGTATATVSGVSAGQTYYIRATGTGGPSSEGAFALLVNAGSGTIAPVPTPNTVVYVQQSLGGGSLYDYTGPSNTPHRRDHGHGDHIEGDGSLIELGNSNVWLPGDNLTVAPWAMVGSGGKSGGNNVANTPDSTSGYGNMNWWLPPMTSNGGNGTTSFLPNGNSVVMAGVLSVLPNGGISSSWVPNPTAQLWDQALKQLGA